MAKGAIGFALFQWAALRTGRRRLARSTAYEGPTTFLALLGRA